MNAHATIALWAIATVLDVLRGAPAAAQDDTRWVPVFVDSAAVVSIDTASVLPLDNDTYRIWERTVDRRSGKVRVFARTDFDCRSRVTRAVAMALPGFTPVRAAGEDGEWTEIVPGTRDEAALRHACAVGRRTEKRPSP